MSAPFSKKSVGTNGYNLRDNNGKQRMALSKETALFLQWIILQVHDLSNKRDELAIVVLYANGEWLQYDGYDPTAVR